MTRYTVRTLASAELTALASIENDVFAAMGEAVLGPHYLRLCTESFAGSCVIALDGDRSVGYLLSVMMRVVDFYGPGDERTGRARRAREDAGGRTRRLHAVSTGIATIHDLELGVRGRFRARPAVTVANHASYLDAIAIAAVLPVARIAKSGVASWPIIEAAASQLGVIFVERVFEGLALRAVRS